MSLKITVPSDRPITVGHGEYIVYHQKSNGEKAAPSREVFNRVYAVLNQFNSPSVDNRYKMIQDKIKAIDPSLEITFVPRTYYEMHFIKKCIKEDLNKKNFCQNEKVRPNVHKPNDKNCWHLIHFSNEEDDNAEAVKLVAFNMNQNLVKKIAKNSLTANSFTFLTITQLTDKQIKFFNQFFNSFNLNNHQNKGEFNRDYFSEATPIHKFSNYGAHFDMRISSLEERKILENAITVECHAIAEKAFLLYRGTEFPTDLPYSPQNIDQPYSFSFGSGIFAGALYRGGATAYHYIKGSPDGYIMAVPAQDLSNNIFVIPKKHTLSHLCSYHGTVFHPRTTIWDTKGGKVWGGLDWDKGFDYTTYAGPFVRDMSKEVLSDQVLKYKNKNVIFLKSQGNETMLIPPAFQPTIHIHASAPQGQTLYVRGEEGGLSWTKGQPLIQVDDNHWTFRISKHFDNLKYKILIDDNATSGWETGNNHELKMGNNAVEAPYFDIPSTPSSGKTTRLSFRYNAGLGNALKIYGSGPGLNWNQGSNLKNAGDDLWIWETNQPFASFEYKVALNGNRWEGGPNHVVRYGKKEEIFPRL